MRVTGVRTRGCELRFEVCGLVAGLKLEVAGSLLAGVGAGSDFLVSAGTGAGLGVAGADWAGLVAGCDWAFFQKIQAITARARKIRTQRCVPPCCENRICPFVAMLRFAPG